MDITVYLPDELGGKAKEAELPFSRLLRGAVEEELERQATMKLTLKNAGPCELHLEDEEGRPYVGQFVGTSVVEDRDVQVFVTEDERVLLYDASKMQVHEIDDAQEELRDWLWDPAYAEAGHALGFPVIVEL